MKVYHVLGSINKDKVVYSVLPYSLFGSIRNQLRLHKSQGLRKQLGELLFFLSRTRITRRAADKLCNHLNTCKDIEW